MSETLIIHDDALDGGGALVARPRAGR